MNDVPTVDMLWESTDAGQALTSRFGFRDGVSAADWVADVLDRYWGLEVERCDRLEEITCDARVADIAKSAVLLGTRYRNWGPTSVSVRAAYVNAYDRQADERLTAAERQEVDARGAALLKHLGWV